MNRDSQQEHHRYNLLRNTTVSKVIEDYINQVSEEIEARVVSGVQQER